MKVSISIITPSFNQSRFIEETIKSVLAQDYDNVEHIVVDGGSTDGTLDVLRKYPHLKVISGPDTGQANAVNKGLRAASGEIIGWLNSDDTFFPGVFIDVAKAAAFWEVANYREAYGLFALSGILFNHESPL